MNDEKTIQVATETSTTQPSENNHDRKHNPVGKIARLPYKLREQLNRRLRNNEPATEILSWLNGLPGVKRTMEKQFDGKPINAANLSKWRYGGYELWLQRQERIDEIQGLAEDARDFSRVADGNLARGTASIAAAKILKMLHEIPTGQGSLNDLTKISFAVSALLNADQIQVRLEHEKTRVFQGNERLVLSWDKHLRGCVDAVQRALNDSIAKEIQEADIDNSEKIELLGHHMFGKKWVGRELPSEGDENPPAQ